MNYAVTLSILGIVLIAWAVSLAGWFWLLAWLGVNLIQLAIAHATGHHRPYAKQADGTLPLWSKLWHLPFLLFTWLTWHLYRVTSREAAWDEISDDLVIGRRLLPHEQPGDFVNYVDLTTEFAEPQPHRDSPGYQSFAVLDGSAPKPEALLVSVRSLKPGRTFIHCAQGHGRTGLFVLAVLLHQEKVKTIEEGLALLRQKRPKVRLNAHQLKVAGQFLTQLHASAR